MLIGVTGKARSGKDTIGRMLSANNGFTRLAFADPLKRAAAALWDIESRFFENDLKEKVVAGLETTPRQLMQMFGDDIKRLYGDDFWIKTLERRIARCEGDVVVTDVRYDNEASAIKAAGGYIVKINRVESGLSGATGKHSSEAGVGSEFVDYEIDNNGSFVSLMRCLDAIMLDIKTRAAHASR